MNLWLIDLSSAGVCLSWWLIGGGLVAVWGKLPCGESCRVGKVAMNQLPTIDRSTWGRGPWDAEPDRVEFEHAGHLGDVIPALPELTEWTDDYRDLAYVRTETTRLAEQLAAKTPRTVGEAEQP